MLKKGNCIKVKTITTEDVFGECVYQVVETGIRCPECHGQDGIKFIMLGGSGPAARPGYPVIDCTERIRRDLAKGITRILTDAEAKAALAHYAASGAVSPRTSSGGIEC